MPEHPNPRPHEHPYRAQGGPPAQAARVRPPASPSPEPYAELSVTTNFTFLTGASHPEEFVRRAAELGHVACAIADTNTLAGIVRAHVAAKDAGMPLAVGCRLVLAGSRDRETKRQRDGEMERRRDGGEYPHSVSAAPLELLVYPTSRAAYARLSRLLTLGKRRAPKGECDLSLHDLIDHAEGLLAVMLPPRSLDVRCIETLEGLRRVFDDDRLSLAACRSYAPDDEARVRTLAALGAHTRVPLAAINDAHYHIPNRRPLHDVVTCIRHGVTIEQAGYRLGANAERHLKPADEMARLFADAPGACARSAAVALRAAAFSLDELRYQYPAADCPEGVSEAAFLRRLAFDGAAQRYGGDVPERVVKLLEYELALITELRYEAYFLTCYGIVVFARTHGILCQGRGGAANSAVCFCLGLTEVDPAEFQLLFERFISRERGEPPDIDIDFEHERREEVIQHIYAKYGRERAALTAEVITYRGRSAVREVSKAMGLSLDRADALAKNLGPWAPGIDAERVRETGLDPDDPTVRQVITLTNQLVGFPRHLSQHVGGFVITRGPLDELVPIENAAMDDRTVIEWDKDDIDAMGMLKVDVLGLGMLTCVHRALVMVLGERHEGTEARRHEGIDTGSGNSKEECNGSNQDVSRPDHVAESHGACSHALPGNRDDAERRTVWAHHADAAGGGIRAIEHRGGIRQAEQGGLSAVLAPGKGIARGTRHTDRAGDFARHAQALRGTERSSARGGSRASRTDPKPRVAPLSSLRASVPPCLRAYERVLHTYRTLAGTLNDPAVYDMICQADTVGVFQIESRAQMSMLPRLRPRVFYDLVIEVAIVRPGPIQGKMVHPYLKRRNGEELPHYPTPEIEDVLGRTLGVPLFQEQAMRLAIVAAGFTPDESDKLRRAMAAWRRKGSALTEFGQRIIAGMLERGYTRDFAERCFEQIKGFSEYGFPESHAASFALLVYVSAWLKRYHPAAFAGALINSQPMGFYAPAQIVRDAREHGVDVRGVDVNRSGWECSLESDGATQGRSDAGKGHEGTEARRHGGETERQRDGETEWGAAGPALRLGMRLVKGLREDDARRVEEAVRAHGPFDSVEALRRASGVSVRGLRCLAKADAFGSMGLDRRSASWAIRTLRDERLPLFDEPDASLEREGMESLPAMAPERVILRDYESTGLSLRAHPVSFIRDRLKKAGAVEAASLRPERESPNGRRVAVAGVVLCRQKPATASGVVFVTLEDETGIANLIIWPKVYERFRRVVKLSSVLLARGRVEREGIVVHVHAESFEGLDGWCDGLGSQSRDFH